MKITNLLLGAAGLLAVVSLPTSSSHAQNIGSYVSSTGADGNSCLRTAPCSSFPGALAKTNAGGKITCIDGGVYGVTTITKSITIDCSETNAEIYVAGGNAIRINAGATDKITLRGIHIVGSGGANTGGVGFSTGAEVHIEDFKFEGLTSPAVLVDKTSPGIITVRNATFQRATVGIKLQSTVPNVVASVSDSRFNNLSGNGVEAGTNSYVAVSNSVFSTNNGSAIIAATATSTVYAENNVISNSATGISAAVAGAKINANGNSIYGSSKAFNVAGGAAFLSGGGNHLDINPGNSPTGSLTWR